MTAEKKIVMMDDSEPSEFVILSWFRAFEHNKVDKFELSVIICNGMSILNCLRDYGNVCMLQ